MTERKPHVGCKQMFTGESGEEVVMKNEAKSKKVVMKW